MTQYKQRIYELVEEIVLTTFSISSKFFHASVAITAFSYDKLTLIHLQKNKHTFCNLL